MKTTKKAAVRAMLVVALGATAAWGGSATDQVRTSVDRVLRIVQDGELRKPANTAARRAQIREVARGLFAFDEMAKRALGRHWTARTPAEQQRFTALFTDLLEHSYVGKIEAYGGEAIRYVGEQQEAETVTVRSKLVTKRGTEIPLDYRLQNTAGRWNVHDVVIEGVSLVSNYRTQFNKILTGGSFEELIRKLEQKKLEVAADQLPRKSGTATP